MAGEMRRPNQLELETQRTNLMLQQTLNNLDQTLNNMQSTQEQLNLGVKLDEVIAGLAQSGMSDKMALREFKRTQQNMAAGLQQQLTQRQMEIANRAQVVGGQLSDVNSQLAMYSPEYSDKPSLETMSGDFDNTLNMNTVVTRYMYGAGGIAGQSRAMRAAGYMTDPSVKEYARGSAGKTIFDSELAWYRKADQLAREGSAFEVRDFMEFERDRMEEVQKAMLNKQVSEALGMRGMVKRSEFESIVQPGLSSFADDYGMAMDQAASIIRKMHDLGVISEKLNTGDSMNILHALDQTDQIFDKLSKVIKSKDVNELVAYADQMTRIGNGDFDAGLRVVQNNTRSIVGGLLPSSQSLEQAAAASQRFGGMFGQETLAAMNAGAWSARAMNMAQNYATGNQFRIGNTNYAADIYTQDLMSQATGIKGLLLASGGGFDVAAGANALMDEVSEKGAVDFYLSMPERMKKAQEKMTGVNADIYMKKQIETLQKEYGLSKDEALMLVLKDPTKIAAYKEMEDAKKEQAKEMQSFFDASKYMGTYTPGTFMFKPLKEKAAYTADEIDLTGDISTELGIRQGITNIGKFLDRIDPTMTLTDDTYDFSRLRKGSKAMSFSISDVQLTEDDKARFGNDNIVSVIVSSLGLPAAQERIDKVIKAVHKGARPKITDLQEILIAALQEYTSTGLLDSPETARKAKEYIASLTPDKAAQELIPQLGKDDPFSMLVNAVRDYNAASKKLLSPEKLAEQQLMASAYEAGVDLSRDVAGSEFLRDASVAMNGSVGRTLVAVGGAMEAAGGILAATGVGGILGGALTLTGAVVAAVPVALDAADALKTTYDVVFNDQVSKKDIVDMLGINDSNLTAIEMELRSLLVTVRSVMARMASGQAKRCGEVLKTLLSNYFAEVKRQDKAADTDRSLSSTGSRKPIEDKEVLQKFIVAQTQNIVGNLGEAGHVRGEDNKYLRSDIDSGKQVLSAVKTVINTVNSPGSPVGKQLRTRDKQSFLATGVGEQIDQITGSDKFPESDWADKHLDGMEFYSDGFQSWQNLMDKGEDMSNVIISEVQNKDKLEQIQQQWEDVSQAITLSVTGDAESKDRSRDIIQKVSSWLKGETDEPVELTEDDFKAIEKTFGKNTAERLRGVMSLNDEAERKTELYGWMGNVVTESGEAAQQAEDRAAEFVKTFTRTAQMILNNNEASDLSRQLYMKISHGAW